ncbi:MAG: ThuA domain-containing protein [Phycisphaerales bacterium]|nr:ThuA domain-containing protein [Phycisphaerales bacterium]
MVEPPRPVEPRRCQTGGVRIVIATNPAARVTSLVVLLTVAVAAAVAGPPPPPPKPTPDSKTPTAAPAFRVLVFSKTAGFRHGCIPDGVAAVRAIGGDRFTVDATEDASLLTAEKLASYRVVVFLNTTGDVLDDTQQAAFEGFIRSGRGYVGVHAAADTEYDWPWYGRLVGAYFKSHPRIQPATVVVENTAHPATKHLAARWQRTDEWYNYRTNPRESVRVLMSLDTASYDGSAMPDDHPIAWYHEYDGGRAFYTGGGHTKESFRDPAFLIHLRGAILWAAGGPNG